MLDACHGRALIDYAWEKIGCQVQIPEEWNDFFDKRGPVPTRYDDERRQFCRFLLRAKMVLIDRKQLHCVWSVDVSRSGIAFLHARQLLPKQRLWICLPDGKATRIRVVRCSSVGKSCYLCGAKFISDDAESG